MSLSTILGESPEYWQSEIASTAMGSGVSYHKVYDENGLTYKELSTYDDIGTIRQFHNDGYNKAIISADGHDMAVQEIRHVPGKYIKAKVLDPAHGILGENGIYYKPEIYNLAPNKFPYKFQNYIFFK